VFAARARRLPLTSGYHTHFAQYSSHYHVGWLMPWVTRWLDALHKRCHATFVPTPELAAYLAARGIPNVHAVGRGVDTKLFHPGRRDEELRKHWGLADDDLACLFVGRLAPEKNLSVVSQAFSAIATRNPRARMIWVGDGPALASLRAAHPQHLFAGSRIGEDLAAHYASADLFLFGSLSETWGNVLTEALASGLSVITYRLAAGEILIRNWKNGCTIKPDDADAFIEAAQHLASNPAKRQELGQQASLSMSAHGWDRIIERYETALLKVSDSSQTN
jgi:glycosyltransferase involved in cell wall biosynthesis